MKVYINGVEKIIETSWQEFYPTIEGTPLLPLLCTSHHAVDMPLDLEYAFEVLLRLVANKSQKDFRRYLLKTDLLDQVIILALHFHLEGVAEGIAVELSKQEEMRIANSECLRCGTSHPGFTLVVCELCSSCRADSISPEDSRRLRAPQAVQMSELERMVISRNTTAIVQGLGETVIV